MLWNWWKESSSPFFSRFEQGWPKQKSPCQLSPFLCHPQSYDQCPLMVEVSGRNILEDVEGPLPKPTLGCLPAQHEALARAPGSSAHLQPGSSRCHSLESALEAHRSQGLEPHSEHSKAPSLRATRHHLSSPGLTSVLLPWRNSSGKVFPPLLPRGGKKEHF